MFGDEAIFIEKTPRQIVLEIGFKSKDTFEKHLLSK